LAAVAGRAGLRPGEQVGEILFQNRQLRLNDPPCDLVVKLGVAVDDLVAEADDSPVQAA
jgi:hypothetical protein